MKKEKNDEEKLTVTFVRFSGSGRDFLLARPRTGVPIKY